MSSCSKMPRAPPRYKPSLRREYHKLGVRNPGLARCRHGRRLYPRIRTRSFQTMYDEGHAILLGHNISTWDSVSRIRHAVFLPRTARLTLPNSACTTRRSTSTLRSAVSPAGTWTQATCNSLFDCNYTPPADDKLQAFGHRLLDGAALVTSGCYRRDYYRIISLHSKTARSSYFCSHTTSVRSAA
ncbi:hypothetical protein K458DRAFT_127786 [Lentithecium fluviatile CBS 122367]|uniref:Uncharacterized protein n=1 Tax=Lentithecium fluviatile CBS 122367 TaxID=1168545 RepID=A0A6G1JH31_9PLEO|nr:hypothetical protein K458DRAFT_127786 [Lentithecium fluviatile CBS 122367]